MNWKQYISHLNSNDKIEQYSFNSPAPHFLLQELKIHFELNELPNELEQLYNQTDGVNEILNGEKIGELIWTADKVIRINNEYRNDQNFRKLYMSFDQLLFIADAENGALFGFVTLDGGFHRNDIFVWNHEDDSRNWVAPSLAKFIEWWTNGTIKV